MLTANLTKNAAGIELLGDSLDLREIYYLVHYLSSEFPLSCECGTALSDYLLGLAYEVRHAAMGDRCSKEMGDWQGDKTIRYHACKIFLPTYFVYLQLIRYAAAYKPTDRCQQSLIYALESCLELALRNNVSQPCIDALIAARIPFSCEYLIQVFETVTYDYIQLHSKRKRLDCLPKIITHFFPYSGYYVDLREQIDSLAQEYDCKISEVIVEKSFGKFIW